MDIFDSATWNNTEDFQTELNRQLTYSSSPQDHQLMAGLVQPQPLIQIDGTIQTPSLSDYDSQYGGLSACPSPYIASPTDSKRRYSLGGIDIGRFSPYSPYMSPIITTTRSHTVKRNKRPSSYTRWTIEEDELLRQAVQLHGPHKWSLIASHIPNRTPMQCSTRWLGALNPNIHKGRWTENEDAVLRYSVLEYANVTDAEGRIQPIPWNKIAERIPNRTGIQCQARWTEALDPYVRKGKWGAEEDALLHMGVNEHGRCWIRIAETIPGRTQRQCRTRWMQIKYKENRQQKQDARRKNISDDVSSQSCLSSDEEEEVEEKQSVPQPQEDQQEKQQVNAFFIVDDFDTQLDASNNNFSTNQQQANNAMDFLKDDSNFFLSADWTLNAYQQPHSSYL